MIYTFPLYWPQGWPRTKYPKRARFQTSQHRAQSGILIELRLLGASGVIISTNLELRRDGLPYTEQRLLSDPGVAVYFTLDGVQQCVPCDKWNTIAGNMQAIHLTVQALRGVERWGTGEMMKASFRGFKALPESVIVTPYTVRPWHEVLQVSPEADKDVVRAAYKRLALKYHPDQGGEPGKFEELQRAFKESGAAS